MFTPDAQVAKFLYDETYHAHEGAALAPDLSIKPGSLISTIRLFLQLAA